jgi:hypothetical protein
MWYSNLLEEYVHYVPVKADLEDLVSQVQWCIKNDAKCKTIASNAKIFYDKYLTKDGIFNYLQNKLSMIYYNKNFKNLLDIRVTKKNIAIISCFRDKGDGKRERERKIFVQVMTKILQPYCTFHIYIIEQSKDGHDFNIGKLKNIGYVLSSLQDKYDHFIFSDIDTLPDYDLMEYFLKTPSKPIALARKGTRYANKDEKIKKPFMGALLSFNSKIFDKINGYPNNFWGWGGEDDSLINRLISNKISSVYYPKKGSIIDIEEGDDLKTIDVKDKVKGEKKDMVKHEKLYNDFSGWIQNGLNTLNYKILERVEINRYTSQIRVDLLKNDDMKNHPEWFPKPINNYERVKNIVSKSWYGLGIEYL